MRGAVRRATATRISPSHRRAVPAAASDVTMTAAMGLSRRRPSKFPTVGPAPREGDIDLALCAPRGTKRPGWMGDPPGGPRDGRLKLGGGPAAEVSSERESSLGSVGIVCRRWAPLASTAERHEGQTSGRNPRPLVAGYSCGLPATWCLRLCACRTAGPETLKSSSGAAAQPSLRALRTLKPESTRHAVRCQRRWERPTPRPNSSGAVYGAICRIAGVAVSA